MLCSRIETCLLGTIDGHGGPEASRYISDHLFSHLMRLINEEGTMSDEVMRKAFLATEEDFVGDITRTWKTQRLIAAVGSCCLVGFVWGDKVFIANVGDSRVLC